MRLGITVDSLSPNLTGIGRYTWELCRGMSTNDAVEDLAFFRQDRWIGRPDALLAGKGIRRSRWPRPIRRWLAQGRFKNRMIHGTNYFLPKMAETGVITVHDMSIFLYPETHPIQRIRDFEKQFTRSLDRAAHIITDSEATRRDFLAHTGRAPQEVTVVHLGVSDAFRPTDRSVRDAGLDRLFGRQIDQYVLAVATFEPRKRIEAAIVAHARFCDRTGSDIPLVLVGAKGWANEALHELIKTEQRKGRLIMLGFVQDSDLPLLYAGADLFLYPSIYEGFGLPPIEAMACGTPTIVSNRSCLPEVTRGAAMMIDPDDVEALDRMIEKGLRDDTWRKAAISAGLVVAAHYSWQECVERTMDVYRMCGAGAG